MPYGNIISHGISGLIVAVLDVTFFVASIVTVGCLIRQAPVTLVTRFALICVVMCGPGRP